MGERGNKGGIYAAGEENGNTGLTTPDQLVK